MQNFQLVFVEPRCNSDPSEQRSNARTQRLMGSALLTCMTAFFIWVCHSQYNLILLNKSGNRQLHEVPQVDFFPCFDLVFGSDVYYAWFIVGLAVQYICQNYQIRVCFLEHLKQLHSRRQIPLFCDISTVGLSPWKSIYYLFLGKRLNAPIIG